MNARKRPSSKLRRRRTERLEASDSWTLDEKARFGELVRRAKTERAQFVTVRGNVEVAVVSAVEFAKLKSKRSGKALVDIMQNCPLGDLAIERPGIRLPVRDVSV